MIFNQSSKTTDVEAYNPEMISSDRNMRKKGIKINPEMNIGKYSYGDRNRKMKNSVREQPANLDTTLLKAGNWRIDPRTIHRMNYVPKKYDVIMLSNILDSQGLTIDTNAIRLIIPCGLSNPCKSN